VCFLYVLCIVPVALLFYYQTTQTSTVPTNIDFFTVVGSIVEDDLSVCPALNFLIMVVSMFLIGVGINAPKTLLSIAVREALPEHISGRGIGVMNLIGQAGGALAGGPMGELVERFGWTAFPSTLLIMLIVLSFSLFASCVCHPNKLRGLLGRHHIKVTKIS